ncbi:PUA-like domain-containing protein [Chytriomyces sp. MP71]|nr:PUA-like domain-containing protein [Chytriomyces sp. MP71]
MFKKFSLKESVSGQSLVKSSQQRAIRAKVQEQYPSLEAVLEDLIPKKAQIVVMKCHDGITIVSVNNQMLFFNHFDGPYMPTLRLLHQFPDMLPRFQVDRGAIKFVIAGASIMCPGLTSKGGNMQPGVPAETPVAIYAEGKEHALGVGWTKMSTEEIINVNKNIGVENMHCLYDGLWAETK